MKRDWDSAISELYLVAARHAETQFELRFGEWLKTTHGTGLLVDLLKATESGNKAKIKTATQQLSAHVREFIDYLYAREIVNLPKPEPLVVDSRS